MAISLFPTPFPIKHYDKAKLLQPFLGTLIAKMAQEPLLNIHSQLDFFYKTNPYIKRLMDLSKIYNAVPRDDRQNIQMLILRTDYMVDRLSNSLKLVEYNTIAAALSSLSQRVWEV